MTQADLAEKLSVGQSNLSYIERGQRDVSVSLLAEIAQALRCRPEEFLDGRKRRSGVGGLRRRMGLRRSMKSAGPLPANPATGIVPVRRQRPSMETPIARQKARSSSASIRRSPRSHLEMNDWVVSNLFASCSCVKPCFSLNRRNNSKNLAYSVECIVFGLLMTPRPKDANSFTVITRIEPKSNSPK